MLGAHQQELLLRQYQTENFYYVCMIYALSNTILAELDASKARAP